MSELNKIFDVKSREARRKILDNYPISANDKNEILNKIGNSSGGEGGNIDAGNTQMLFNFITYNIISGLEYHYMASIDLCAKKVIYSKYKDYNQTPVICTKDEYINNLSTALGNNKYVLYVQNIDFDKKQITIKANKNVSAVNPWSGDSINMGFCAYESVNIKNYVQNPEYDTPKDVTYNFNSSLTDFILNSKDSGASINFYYLNLYYLDDINNTAIYPKNYATSPIIFTDKDDNKIIEIVGDVSTTFGYVI